MQNKIKLLKIIENTLNRGQLPVVMWHHDRDFINESVQTLSEKSINRFKQGRPVDAIIIPVSLNDENAQKIPQIKASSNGRDFLQENHALSKMVMKTFEIAGNIAFPRSFDEDLKTQALDFQQRLQKCGKTLTETEIHGLAKFNFPENHFADFCERAFKQTKIHVLFTDVQNLSKEFQMRLNSFVKARFQNLKLGYAYGTNDLKTWAISENHFLEELHDVNFRDIDNIYWCENIHGKEKNPYTAQAIKEYGAYLHTLKNKDQQQKLPLRDYI